MISDIFDIYLSVLNSTVSDYSMKRTKLKLPLIPKDDLDNLLEQARVIFDDEPIMLRLKSPIIVVGDLHGHILDLFRILKTFGLPPQTRYLFLGDFVDRGEFSTETVTFALVLKILYPDDFYMIRGNHEFDEICDHCGFFTDITSLYGDAKIYSSFIKTFSYMPLAASIDDDALCVHGGIGPSLFMISQVESMQRPITKCDDKALIEILWSDPKPSIQGYAPSDRGLGYYFGTNEIMKFLERSEYTVLIRGHQCVANGVESSCNNRVITVFSASNYCGVDSNQAGVLKFRTGCPYDKIQFPPLGYLKRNEASLVPMELMKKVPRAATSKLNKKDDVQLRSLIALPRPNRRLTGDQSTFANTSRLGSMPPRGRKGKF